MAVRCGVLRYLRVNLVGAFSSGSVVRSVSRWRATNAGKCDSGDLWRAWVFGRAGLCANGYSDAYGCVRASGNVFSIFREGHGDEPHHRGLDDCFAGGRYRFARDHQRGRTLHSPGRDPQYRYGDCDGYQHCRAHGFGERYRDPAESVSDGGFDQPGECCCGRVHLDDQRQWIRDGGASTLRRCAVGHYICIRHAADG